MKHPPPIVLEPDAPVNKLGVLSPESPHFQFGEIRKIDYNKLGSVRHTQVVRTGIWK